MLARTSLHAFRHPSRTSRPFLRPLITPQILRCSRNSPSFRVFTSTPRHRKDDNRISEHPAIVVPKLETAESVRPVLVQKKNSAEQNATGKQDGLLAEKITSNVEQRKADWAIMKEMTKYLWPKVHKPRHCYVSKSLLAIPGQSRYQIPRWTICRSASKRKGTSSSLFVSKPRSFIESNIVVERSSTLLL